MMSEDMQTQACKDFMFNGFHPDGSVHWPSSGITSCLREAENNLAQAG